jgi:DNA processing protein
MQSKWQDFKFHDEAERWTFILISGVVGLGRRTLSRLINTRIQTQISFGEILGKSIPDSYKNQLNNLQIDGIKSLIKEQNISSFKKHLDQQQIIAITIFDHDYPKLLKESDDPPLVFYYSGDPQLLIRDRWIAIVGTRKMTRYGQQSTQMIVRELVRHNWGIVSGGMYGVDAAAHQACLESGGKTIAILGYGLGYKTSYSAKSLEEKILNAGGGLISEFLPNTPSQASHFPLRNRIVAGLSQAVVVVEAAEKSGSHITAQCGLDYGRVVAAVPGPITSPYSQGTKDLLNQGAVCVSSAADILTEINGSSLTQDTKLGGESIENSQNFQYSAKSLEKEIYDMLRTHPCTTQDVVKQISKPLDQIMVALSNLEMSELIDRTDTMWGIIL